MTDNFKRLLPVIMAVQMLTGCTTRTWYQALQVDTKQACQRQPSSEQERCEASLNKQDFDTYEKNRSAR